MKIVLIEDEAPALRRLEKIIAEHAPDAEIVQRLDSVEATVQYLQQQPAPDLIFMDIHLADGSAFDVFEQVEVSAPIVFTTAFDAYTLRAFKVNAIDYLMKPIKSEEVKAALEKFHQWQIRVVTPPLKAAPAEPLRRILVRLGQSMRLVEVQDVAYFYTRDKLTFLVTRSTGKRYPLDMPLDRLEDCLDSSLFFRINRQFIVQIHAIKEMHPHSKSRLKIDLDPPADVETVVSTERAADFRQWLVGG
jgi:two-component system response regulator LytT